jgi:cytochrome P450
MPTDAPIDVGLEPLVGEDLHQRCAALRRDHRVAPVRFYGREAVLITRFADVQAALRYERRFPGGDYYALAMEPALGPTFISMNGREHDRHRQLATPAFRSRAISRFDLDALLPLTHEIIDRFSARGEADLVTELTSVLPFVAMARRLGVPRDTESDMRQFAEASTAAADAFSARIAPLLEARRDEPSDDVLSALVGARLDGEALSDAEVLSTIRMLLGVGALTVEHALGTMFLVVLRTPGLLEAARGNPELCAQIVHEVLRWEGPVAMLPRLVPRDVTFADAEIPAGSIALFGLASANRDPAMFEDPDAFDPARPPQDVLTFGFGNKFCPGSHLARRELVTALSATIERLPGLRLCDDTGTEIAGGVHRFPTALHCAWDV